MSQAEALLNSLAGTVVDHKHEVPDSDTHFIIDPYTRQIENTNYQKTVLMRGDHNSERFTFEVPRYVDGHDMSLCNRVIVHFDNVGDSIENVYSDVAYMDDLRINPDKPDTVISSWLIRREATQIVGILSFSLQYQCVENEEVTYEWNTDSYDDIEIRKSKNNGEAAVIQYTNVLEEWRSKIFGAGDSVMTNITTEGANQVTAVKNESASQQAAIELKGSETLATIPEDYTEVYNMAEEALRTKADGVVCEAEGNVISINDASDDYLRGLNIYGKTTQFTTTGKNLLNLNNPSRTYNGITYTVQDDGGIHVTGTSTANSWFTPGGYVAGDERLSYLPAGTYFLSGNKATVANVTGYINGYYADDNTATTQINDNGSGGRSFTLDRDAYVYYQIMIGPDVTVDTIIYPQIEVGNIATDWEPYTGGVASPNPDYPQEIVSIENPTTTIYGKNLICGDVTRSATMSNGITINVTKGSSEFVLGGTQNGTTNSSAFLVRTMTLYPGTYTLSAYGLVGSDYINVKQLSGTQHYLCIAATNSYPKTFTVGQTVEVGVEIVTNMTSSYNGDIVKLQLEYGTSVTEYEPYKSSQTINFTNILHGIPVTPGGSHTTGNYIDENGQQWICDEVDLERGVYIQRVLVQEFTGEEAWTINPLAESLGTTAYHTYNPSGDMEFVFGLCSHFINAGPWSNGLTSKINAFWTANATTAVFKTDGTQSLDDFMSFIRHEYESGNPVTFYSVLRTPIETPLTADEIETYKTLKSNYPNTTILNNAGAMMKVKYNADTKLYINNAAVNGAVSVVEEVLNDTY